MIYSHSLRKFSTASNKIVLHGNWNSGCTRRVRTVLNFKNLEFEFRRVDLSAKEQHGEEYRKINPTGQVPAVMIDNHILTESLPICEYLEERFESGPSLLPKDAVTRFQVRRYCEMINSGIHPL